MRSKRDSRRWAGDDAAHVAVAAAGGIVAALFAVVLVVDEVTALAHGPFALLQQPFDAPALAGTPQLPGGGSDGPDAIP